MAKVRLNPILEQVRGQVGDLVFKRSGENVVISRKPDFSDRVCLRQRKRPLRNVSVRRRSTARW